MYITVKLLQLVQIPTPSALSGTCTYPNQAADIATKVHILWPRVVGVIEAPHLAKPYLAEHIIVEISLFMIVCVGKTALDWELP